ncbi:type II toxin-antitoxin system PrlF family antitoxin [Aureimonas sp. AU12]|uniref:type II toxin-antitoxin system PrlF family antitoxin n=1 Tax=Aureimonas sp. AU12 TaxID=1638161 RepID=UPI000781D6AF|nr:type II toxin-antitoxin system PrlF family antitoxin [Aureimonas sp. AU12]
MITSRLSSKSQTTIPQAVRKALKLREGDELMYLIDEEGRVVLTRVPEGIFDDPFVTFTEWNSEEDEKGYANL